MTPPSEYRDPPEYGGGAGVHFAMPPFGGMVKVLILANVAVHMARWLLGLFFPDADRFVVDAFSNHPATWRDWFPFVPVWQLVTCMFLHGDGWHLVWNMLSLYFLGNMVEGTVGARRFTSLYFAAGLVASVASLVIRWALGSTGPGVGASGAIFGVILAAATLFPHRRILLLFIPVKLWVLAAILVVLNSMTAIEELAGRNDSMQDIWAHLFGGAVGYAFVKLGWIWVDHFERLEQLRVAREAKREQHQEFKLDELLERIHRDGIGSLSRAEKAFLKRASKRK